MRTFKRMSVAIAGWILLFGSLSIVGAPVAAHGVGTLESGYASIVPVIDGLMSAGEWADAASVDLGAIPGNALPAFLLVMNDEDFLWLAYDATGDTTASANDSASFAIDTGHDGVGTNDHEDQFVVGGVAGGLTAHLVYRDGTWVLHEMPFDPGLPGHDGLEGAWGFGPSDLSGLDHRIYEFQVPLVLLGASAGETLGLFGGSRPVPGVLDLAETYRYSTWPTYVGGPIALDRYGDLILADTPGPVAVRVIPPFQTGAGDPGTSVRYPLTILNRGTSGNDTFDITYFSSWTLLLWDATGTIPLGDSDADGDPDTGPVAPGSSVGIVVEVQTPTERGCDLASIYATSSLDTLISDWANISTCNVAATFEPPFSDRGVDLDGNGSFDLLEVRTPVDVTAGNDTFEVHGSLYTAFTGIFLAEARTSFTAVRGLYEVALNFSGLEIGRSGQDGPYRVEAVLRASDLTVMDSEAYETAYYRASDFEGGPVLAARFDPPHRDFGRDTDIPPNGRYDDLVIEVSLEVNRSSDFAFFVRLRDANATLYLFLDRYVSLPEGPATVEFAFPGREIVRTAAEGPYTVQMELYDLRSGRFLDHDIHVTGPYSPLDFDGPAILFTGPHQDTAVDGDVPPGDGFDWILLRARVAVSEPGAYVVAGFLTDRTNSVFISAATTVVLEPGPQTVELRFPAARIRESGVDGPYYVSLFAGTVPQQNESAYDSHVTQPYPAAQFAPRSGRLAPPHADGGLDTGDPPDGWYDELVLDIGVNVDRRGAFEVEAIAISPTGKFLDASATDAVLPVGRSVVRVSLDGRAIRDEGIGGPYFVIVYLYDRFGFILEQLFYTTQAYDAEEFQPADGDPPDSRASLGAGYWHNAATLSVTFEASDPSPTDGLESVTLMYRYSADNATWSEWDAFETKSVSGASTTGSFLFQTREGDGYYEFAAVAVDAAGNSEDVPLTAEARVAVFVPARLVITPSEPTAAAGNAVGFEVRVVNATGVPVTLAVPLAVDLFTTSSGGRFRVPGSTADVVRVTIAAGSDSASFEYVDGDPGSVTVLAVASGVNAGRATVTVTGQTVGVLGSGDLLVGIGSGTLAGLLVGIGISWLVTRRKKKTRGSPPQGAP